MLSNLRQVPHSTPPIPTKVFPRFPPNPQISLHCLPLIRPSVFTATTILSHYLQLITVFSYLPSRNYSHLHRRLPRRLSTLDSILHPNTCTYTCTWSRSWRRLRSSLAGNTVKTRCCLSLGRFCFHSVLKEDLSNSTGSGFVRRSLNTPLLVFCRRLFMRQNQHTGSCALV